MTAVSATVYDSLVGEPCLECGDGTLERKTVNGEAAIVCDSCANLRGVRWGVDR